MRKARILAGKFQEVFDSMSKYDKEVEELLNNPLSAHMKMSLERKPDGTIAINNLELDPDKPEIEKELFESAIDKLSRLKIDPAPPPPPIQPQESNPSVSLKKLIDEYLEAVSKDIDDEKTLRGYKSHLDTFLDIIGDIPVNEITSKRAREAVATLKQLPPNRNKLSAYRSLSIAAIIELKPPKTLSNTTVKLHINRAKALFGFGKDEQLCTLNPFGKIKVKNKRRPDQERKPFEDEDLKALFIPEEKRTKAGYPSRLWVPYLAAYSGMRLEECCQLEISDIIKSPEGIFCFDINDNGDKKLKNPSAHRIVPIHSKLIEKGFLDYVDSLSSGKLFPELIKGNGKYGHHFSKWFTRYRRKVGVNEEGKTLHSFRHGVATLLKRSDIDEAKVASVLGHQVVGESFGRYGKSYTAQQLKDVIEIINYGNAIP